jgi:hypothetical protein
MISLLHLATTKASFLSSSGKFRFYITDRQELSDHLAQEGDEGSCGGVYVTASGSYLCNDKGRYIFLSNDANPT